MCRTWSGKCVFLLSCGIQMCNRGFNPGFAFYITFFYFTSGRNCSVTASDCHGCVSWRCGTPDGLKANFFFFFLALIRAFLWVWPVALIRLNPSILLCVRLTYNNYSQSLATFLVVSEMDLLRTGLTNSNSRISRGLLWKRQKCACTEMFQLSVRTTDAMKILLSLSFYFPRGCRRTAALITAGPRDSPAPWVVCPPVHRRYVCLIRSAAESVVSCWIGAIRMRNQITGPALLSHSSPGWWSAPCRVI